MAPDQLTKLIDEQTPSLLRAALKFTHDLEDAQDLLQDTIFKAISFIESYEEGSNLNGWLYVIMRNTFINNYRKSAKIKFLVCQQENISEANLLVSATSNTAVSNFAIADITKALNGLPKACSTSFIRFTEGYKYEEIAKELGIPLGTVKTRIHQARELLKLQLKTYRTSTNKDTSNDK